jgi:ribosomal protein L31E
MAGKLMTIGIRRYLVTQPRTKRARKAARYIRERIAHYTKVEIDNVKFGKDLNEAITKKANHMRPVKLNIDIDKGIVTASLFKEQAAQSAPKAAEQKKQPAKAAEGKEPQAKSAPQAAPKEKPAKESVRKSQEKPSQNTSTANASKIQDAESRKAANAENSQK